jgi:hypothetical protein
MVSPAGHKVDPIVSECGYDFWLIGVREVLEAELPKLIAAQGEGLVLVW